MSAVVGKEFIWIMMAMMNCSATKKDNLHVDLRLVVLSNKWR